MAPKNTYIIYNNMYNNINSETLNSFNEKVILWRPTKAALWRQFQTSGS